MGGNADIALRLYVWNIAVSSAFWGPLQVLEVVLRNALHDRLTARFSREDWWNAKSLTLTVVHQRAVADAYARVADSHAVAARLASRIRARSEHGSNSTRISTDVGHFGIASRIMSRFSIGISPRTICTSSGLSG
jgi:hypothetical protein